MTPVLYIVIPCYNEEKVLPVTAPLFLEEILHLEKEGKISGNSRVMFVDDGSSDQTWNIISELSKKDGHFEGVRLSRNRGHQNALLAGLTEAREKCDITISIDCDGQDDIRAMDEMVDAWHDGCEIVYGVRKARDTDTFFKRFTAESFYRLIRSLGGEVVFNHADYRLVSSRALEAFKDYKEVNIFLRGMFPMVGFKSTCVYYDRAPRLAGESHYPLRKMLALAIDGITSLSVQPIRLITGTGLILVVLSLMGILWAIIRKLTGHTVTGWASLICVFFFLGSVQLLSLGVLGEYIGKIYLETKHRPRFFISERTDSRESKYIQASKASADEERTDASDAPADRVYENTSSVPADRGAADI